ncbi:MAG: CPBP family intramembrane metalloprotease [Acidimicrobiaceae bacterium]|nr:CPBP family intramembrane metalloprotease [Acidimicrobiaceae bacterium]
MGDQNEPLNEDGEFTLDSGSTSSEQSGGSRMDYGITTPWAFPIFAFVLSLVTSSIGVIVASALSGSNLSASSTTLTEPLLIGSLGGLWVVFFGASLVASHRWGTGRISHDLGIAIKASDLIVGFVVGVAAQLILVPVVYLAYQFLTGGSTTALSAPAQKLVNSGGGGASEVLVGALIVVGAPIVEEIFFRGLTQRSFQYATRKMTARVSKLISLLGSSIIFTVAHFEGLQSFGLFAVALVLGYLAMRNRRLGTSMVAHASFNLVSFVALVHH